MSAPLTLAQCRAVIDTIDGFGCSRCEDSSHCDGCEFSEYKGLLATIEWLAERLEELDCDTCAPDGPLRKWLRGEA